MLTLDSSILVPLMYAADTPTKSYKSDKEKEMARCPHYLMPNHQGATSKDLNSKDSIQAHWYVADNKSV
jgi:hypothetical protein